MAAATAMCTALAASAPAAYIAFAAEKPDAMADAQAYLARARVMAPAVTVAAIRTAQAGAAIPVF